MFFWKRALERNTRAQKDKQNNRKNDFSAARFSGVSYSILLLVIMAFVSAVYFLSNAIASRELFNFGQLLLIGCILVSFVFHSFWIATFELNYARGAQRWRQWFFLSDIVLAVQIGIVIAWLSALATGKFFTVTVSLIVVFSIFLINYYSPYRRVLQCKLSAIWLPVLLSQIITLSEWSQLQALSVTPVLFLAVIMMGKKIADDYWKMRESEYLLRLKMESYQASVQADDHDSKLHAGLIAAYTQELKIRLDNVLNPIHLLVDTPISLPQKELIEKAENAAQRTIQLIDSVNDYSKKPIDSHLIELQIFPVVKDLEDIFVTIAKEGHEQGIETQFSFDKHVPQRVKTDKKLLSSIVNLLLNCMLRANTSGQLSIATNFQSRDSITGDLTIVFSDVVDAEFDQTQHPIYEKLILKHASKAVMPLNFLMAEKFAHRLDASIHVFHHRKTESHSDHVDDQSQENLSVREKSSIGIELTIPVEAKSSAIPDFVPNTKLSDISLAVVNCPSINHQYIKEVLMDWGLRLYFYEENQFDLKKELVLSKQKEQKQSKKQKPLFDDEAKFHTSDKTTNERLKENDINAVLWFAAVADEKIFDSNDSIVKKAIYQNDHMSSRPVFVVATDRQIQTSLHRQFLMEQPNIHAIQSPLQLEQFHHLLVDALFNIDFQTHHALNKLLAVDDDGSDRERILLVEDHRVNQMVAKGMLKRLGYTAKIANNGIEALDLLEEQDFDLILMDCQMAEMDGFKATEAIRFKEQLTDKHIPIIALTANTTEEDQNKCLAVGMDDYLAKPVSYNDLEHSLKRWLDDGSRPTSHH